MQLNDIFLYSMGGILTLFALVAAYFMLSEAGVIFRDTISRGQTQHGHEGDGDSSGRQINPFRDRDTVERIVTHLEDGEEEGN